MAIEKTVRFDIGTIGTGIYLDPVDLTFFLVTHAQKKGDPSGNGWSLTIWNVEEGEGHVMDAVAGEPPWTTFIRVEDHEILRAVAAKVERDTAGMINDLNTEMGTMTPVNAFAKEIIRATNEKIQK